MHRNLQFLRMAILVALTAFVSASSFGTEEPAFSWDMVKTIRERIQEPVFPDRSVNVTDFGAVPGDGKLDTKAIQDAIQNVHENGGGTVIVPKGTFDTGALRLLSGVNLHLEDPDSILLFTTEITEANYPVVYSHWEATPCYNYSALIYAKDAENIALTGKGVLNAQSNFDTVWWNWRNRVPVPGSSSVRELQSPGQIRTREQNNAGTPVEERIYGDGWYLRPNFIQTIGCKNVLLEGVTLLDSPMWQVNPVLCTNVIIRGMTLRAHGYNTDCVDPESCTDVLIENNLFDSGDDCIAIKSGRDRDGRELNTPSQNILIFNNQMADGHGGIAMGSEMSGGIRNVFADGNHFDSPKLTYPLRLKTNAKRGGVIENVYLRNSNIANVDQAVIHGTMLYAEGRIGNHIPTFQNIVIENVKAQGGLYGIFLEAFPESPITGLVLKNVDISGVKYPLRAMNWAPDVVMDNVSINGRAYPAPTEARILGIPAPGETVKATALLIGGDDDSLSYLWEAADEKDGAYAEIAQGESFTMPADSAGKYIRVSAIDNNGRTERSMPYRVLRTATAAGLPAGGEYGPLAARLATRGVLDEDATLDPDQDITRIELARMLFRLWNLAPITSEPELDGFEPGSPDAAIAAAVLKSGMMTLDKHLNSNLTDIHDNRPGTRQSFLPGGPVTREEMGTIAMMSCGVSYKNASNTYDTSYNDGKEISNVNLTDVERGTTLGFWDRGDGNFHPKQNMTWGMCLDVLNRIADFAGK